MYNIKNIYYVYMCVYLYTYIYSRMSIYNEKEKVIDLKGNIKKVNLPIIYELPKII